MCWFEERYPRKTGNFSCALFWRNMFEKGDFCVFSIEKNKGKIPLILRNLAVVRLV